MGSAPTPSTKITNTVYITVVIDSSRPNAPYYASYINGTVGFEDGSTQDIGGFGLEDIGEIPSGGASFNLQVQDVAWTLANQTQILRWALTFLPRPGVSQPAPIANALMSGNGATSTTAGTFVLIDRSTGGNQILRNSGNGTKDWDWFLMVQVQVQMPGQSSIKTFVSDPEMQMDTETGN